jgi:glycosyltransferase involved in cell wall biosynthesis
MGKSVLLLGVYVSQHGGVYRAVCEEIADRLEERGWRVTRSSGVKSRPRRLLDMLVTTWRARREYQLGYIEVFSGLGFIQAEACAFLLRALGKPIVLALHGGNLPEFARRNPARVRRLLGMAAAITAPSDYLRAALSEYTRTPILLMPNALEIAAYPFRLRAQPAPRLVWLRALHSIYNPVMAVEVVDRLRSTFPDVHLNMVGPDKGDGALQAVQAAIAERGLQHHITLTGGVPKSDVPVWLEKADVFISTTNFDNTPVSVMEALTSGLPVVSTNVGGVPALVTHDEQALLVPAGDASAMAQAVERILTEPGLSERLSCAGHAHASQFSWTTMLPRWESLFSSLMSFSVTQRGMSGEQPTAGEEQHH